MLETRIDRAGRTATVREDWSACLPEPKDRLFAFTDQGLEISYGILSVTLDEALTLCKQGEFHPANQQATIFAEFFDRLAVQLRGVLRTLLEHGRRFGTLPNVAPLDSGFFRSRRSQQIARANSLRTFLMLRSRKRFFRKLGALEQVVTDLNREAGRVAEQVGSSPCCLMTRQWLQLETLHHDLNTCLCETKILLKSFFCALPADEVQEFRALLLSLVPSTAGWTRHPSPFANRQAAVPTPYVAADLGVPPEHHPRQTQDNSRSRDGIPQSRTRPDGTGGPNETN